MLLTARAQAMEDADPPRALQLAVDAWQAYERMGSPEGDLALGCSLELICHSLCGALPLLDEVALEQKLKVAVSRGVLAVERGSSFIE